MPDVAPIETLAFGYGLIEGPCVDPDGALLFSDVHGGGVHRRTVDGAIETVVPKRRGVGGIALHADGGIVISGRSIQHVRDGETRTLYESGDVPGFNDLTVDAQGRVLTGTMRSDPFSASGPRERGECVRIDAEGRTTELYGDISLTNGLGFSPDGATLYHADTAPGLIWAHDIADDGSCTNRREFARPPEGAPDGLAVDEEGGVWTAAYGGGGVTRFSPDGAFDRHVAVPAAAVTSLCFGGADGRDLYIVTADNTNDPQRGGTIFRTRSDVAGLPIPPARI